MSISGEILQRIAALNLPSDQLREVLSIFADAVGASTSDAGKIARSERNRRYYQRKNMSAAEWESLRAAVFLRDKFVCGYCQETILSPHCDRVIPLIGGGSSEMANLVTACPRCNGGKSGRTPEEWLG